MIACVRVTKWSTPPSTVSKSCFNFQAEKSLEDSERVQKKLGMTLGQSIVPGEAAFKVETAGSLLSVSSMEPGGSGAVSLGSGGVEMDTSIGGSGGTPFQALVSALQEIDRIKSIL